MPHSEVLSDSIQSGLGIYYFFLVLMNLGFAYYCSRQSNKAGAALWTLVAGIFLVHCVVYFLGVGWTLPIGVRHAVDNLMNPVSYFVLSVLGFILFLRFRK